MKRQGRATPDQALGAALLGLRAARAQYEEARAADAAFVAARTARAHTIGRAVAAKYGYQPHDFVGHPTLGWLARRAAQTQARTGGGALEVQVHGYTVAWDVLCGSDRDVATAWRKHLRQYTAERAAEAYATQREVLAEIEQQRKALDEEAAAAAATTARLERRLARMRGTHKRHQQAVGT